MDELLVPEDFGEILGILDLHNGLPMQNTKMQKHSDGLEDVLEKNDMVKVEVDKLTPKENFKKIIDFEISILEMGINLDIEAKQEVKGAFYHKIVHFNVETEPN